MIRCNPIPLKAMIALCIAILTGILILGFNPRHTLFINKVSRIPDTSGIRFQKYGMAYTKSFEPVMGDETTEASGFSMEIAFKSIHRRKNGFGPIVMFHDGNDGSQLLIGQWHSHVIVMNGDDYDYRRKSPRFWMEAGEAMGKTIVVRVTTGRGGTRLYLDGRFIAERKKLTLTMPDGRRGTRLVLGNSVYGNNPWEGDIYGFAVYPYPLAAVDVLTHYDRWEKKRDFSYALDEAPGMLYLFDDVPGRVALDRSGRGLHLQIPKRVTILKRQVLSFSLHELTFKANFIQDVIINFLGFMPLGLILVLTLRRCHGPFEKYAVAIAVLLGFAVSLFIEIGQSWIPSRTSSLLDLVLNTAGTASGVALRGMFCRKFFTACSPDSGVCRIEE